MLSSLKPGRELTRAFDELLLARYYATGRQSTRRNLSNGDPVTRPFEPVRDAVQEAMAKPEMALYSRGGGPKQYRDKILPYCEDLGISPLLRPLNNENITFGIGSTYLYSAILRTLAEKNATEHSGKKPILLMPAPTYGIFTMQPAHLGYDIETFKLR